MRHPHRIQEIATRAGLSPATVDRVLHQRGGVREGTARRVRQAIAALDRELSATVDLPVAEVDCFDAGATAGYLLEQWLHDRAGDVLVVGGVDTERRVAGFRSVVRPSRRLRLVTGPDQVRALLAGTHTVRAAYATRPGATAEVVAAFEAENRNYDVFLAHGLDRDNLALLRARRINAVLHQDHGIDLRRSDRADSRAHTAPPGPIRSQPAAVKVITPFNAPVS
ncbi:hypothetical protein Acy02nite_17490 [Actinoplanes cyaneus]|uniref:HTH lacI-type domain-containing protein n=1 Tax=Actinoplanes cyaneus TaxID=52696 RepID=A0A919II44_9ACTN|nr:LacI family DNA-binding transcriptional regulator [Actinoplanes cyaneus]MCW2136980.1 LacI family transcriptional regulator [Actinoplanes cyaneus]GID63868.1 hypothetical protein Acy02nite_17490 [Actinoplanes cyaneus]